jgi:YHS domain-containing protein
MSKFAVSALAALLLAATALAAPPEAAAPGHHGPAGIVRLSCPVLTAHMDSEMKAIPVRVNGLTAYACSDVALELFKKEPAKYLKENVPDPVTGTSFQPTAKTPKVVRGNAVFLFSSPETKATFLSDPEKYSKPRLP